MVSDMSKNNMKGDTQKDAPKQKKDTKLSLMDEYTHWTNFAKEKYGEKSFVFLQGGDFFEILGDDESNPIFDVCRDILCIRIAQRNRTESSGFVAGFPMHSSKSYEAKLLDHGYTIVFVLQTGTGKNISRSFSHVLSPGCHMSDPLETHTSAIMASLLVEQIGKQLFYSLCFYDAHLGTCRIASTGGIDAETCHSLIRSNDFHEMLVTYVKKSHEDAIATISEIQDRLELGNILIHEQHFSFESLKKTYLDIDVYQQHALETFFKQYTSLYQNIFDVLELNQCASNDVANLIMLLEFLKSRGEVFTTNLVRPTIQMAGDTSILRCYHDAHEKLQIIQRDKKATSLFTLLDKTKSSAGSRCFKRFLQHPLTDIDAIQKRHDCVANMLSYMTCDSCDSSPDGSPPKEFLSKHLKMIDLDRMHRSFSLASLKRHHIPKLWTELEKISLVYDFLASRQFTSLPTEDDWVAFLQFKRAFLATFDIEKCNNETQNMFQPGISDALDALFEESLKYEEELEHLRADMSRIISDDGNDENLVQLKSSDKEGYFFATTHKRAILLEKNIKDEVHRRKLHNELKKIEIDTAPISSQNSQNSSSGEYEKYSKYSKIKNILTIHTGLKINKSKVSSVTIQCQKSIDTSFKLGAVIEQRTALTKSILKEKLCELYSSFGEVFQKIASWIAKVDVYYSYAVVAKEWNYTRPTFTPDASFSKISATKLRHPIIEQLNVLQHNEYIPNDISLDAHSNVLLYGVNSSGKSSLMKSIGIAIIMAQAGMYVAAETCSIVPYHQLFLRMGNGDSLIDGHSSFTCEMQQANTILNKVTPQSIVFADEFCASTESTSATLIVASTIETLTLKRATFFFATHLFELLDMKNITHLPGLSIKHLKVELIQPPEAQLKFSKNNTENSNTKTGHLHFARTLTDGPPSMRQYGTFVCKKICTNSDFLVKLERNIQLLENNGVSQVNQSLRSNYNSRIVMDACALCGYVPLKKYDLPLETHHIKFQCTANQDGFIEHFHKNQKHNLVVTCKKCHIDIHHSLIDIQGYQQTDAGAVLKFTKNTQNTQNTQNTHNEIER